MAADRLGIPTLQTSSLKPAGIGAHLENVAPDLIVVAAFGIILGPRTLQLPRLGCVNLHASLLPAYRGANPIAAAIAKGESETGVTLMRMDRGLDTGPVLAMRSLAILPDDTTATLTGKLAQVGADLLTDSLGGLLAGVLPDRPQGPGATLTRPMTKDDGWIDWHQPAAGIERHVRAMLPWPRAWTTFPDGSRLQVLVASVEMQALDAEPGTLLVDGSRCEVATGDGVLQLEEVQLPGGKPLPGRAIADRLKDRHGQVLGREGQPEQLSPLVRNLE
jgi:methionyl-tRNA formyltransferase